MPYTSPATGHNPTTGNVIPASWGDDVNSAADYLATNFPHCSIYESSVQIVSSGGSGEDLTSNEERSDVGGMHSVGSNTERITIPASEGGLYACSATVEFAANATGTRVVQFVVNNTTTYDVYAGPGYAANVLICGGIRFINLAAADYVTCRAYQDSGGDLDVQLLDFTVAWQATA